ncbi:hypothetical protein BTI53_02340 [Lactobacillus delbrueckii subsp. bulgaricus]|nr:hypothetical protein [Lactobacillus delbrueckii subsp. bulgaricus]
MLARNTKTCRYIGQVLDANFLTDQSVSRHSFYIKEVTEPVPGFVFIPVYPTQITLNSETYYRIYDIVSPALFPDYTCIRPSSMQIVEVDDEPLTTSRGFFFPWKTSRSKRLFGSVESILTKHDLKDGIPIMDGITVGRSATTWIISGNTGSGKSYCLRYFLEIWEHVTNRTGTKPAKLILIDPKKSNAARYARGHKNIQLIVPDLMERPEDFLMRTNEVLANVISEQNRRQADLFNKSKRISTDASELDLEPIYVIIEEMASLTLSLPPTHPQVKDLFRQLEQIALLGREALINLVITSQIARNDVVPIPIRSQMNVRILLGRIDKATVQYLFPSMTEGLSIPIGGKGSGIIEIQDGNHFGVEPVEMPTIGNF